MTSCVHPVQEYSVLWRAEENRSGASAKAAPDAQIETTEVRNGLPARIFTVDNRRNERTIQNGQVSQLSPNPHAVGIPAGHE